MSDKQKEVVSGFTSLRKILEKHESQLMNYDKRICLLCKRQFETIDQIDRHQNLSQLHSMRLRRLSQRIFTADQLERMDHKTHYRDRARERRLEHGETDRSIAKERSVHPTPTTTNEPNSSKQPASSRKTSYGLGYTPATNMTYKDAVKEIMYRRYHEISSEDE